MAEIEPASDDHVSSTGNAVEYGMTIPAEEVAPILARLRKAERDRAHWHECFQVAVKTVVGESGLALHDRLDQLRAAERERDDLRADNANMAKLLSGYHQICSEAGIAPATSEIYAAAERATQGGENG